MENKMSTGEVKYIMFNSSKKLIKNGDYKNTFEDISHYKDKMSEEDFNLFKAFCLGYSVIDLHLRNPLFIVMSKKVSDKVDKEEQEKEKSKPSLENVFDFDVEKELKDLLDAVKRL